MFLVAFFSLKNEVLSDEKLKNHIIFCFLGMIVVIFETY
jgi:hypothetical protein